jgi:CRP-like cAMP-binding protein
MKALLTPLLPEERINDFFSLGKASTISSSEYFIRAGDVPSKFAFVGSGLFRYVYTHEKGHEFTKGIIAEQNFISSYSAMKMGKPSYFSIEALEDSQVLEIQWADFQRLLDDDVFWLRFLLKFLEKGFMMKEKRERDLLLLDAEARYKNFLKEYPGLDQRISQGVVASYLGIKAETLSRIRSRMVF